VSRRALIQTTVAVLVALGLSPAAAAHGGGAAKGYASTITAVTPSSSALHLTVLDADDRLQLRVDGDHTVLIAGYEGEPYLRFSPEGVYRNMRSPATYLNDDRYGNVTLPAAADPEAPPDWVQVAPGGRAYDWHDHRIHWMSPTYPSKIEADKSRPQHIFDWTVSAQLDGRPLLIAGTLDYRPPPGQTFPLILIIPIAVIALGGAVAFWLRRRPERGASDSRRSP
jgi:hypothetical protein